MLTVAANRMPARFEVWRIDKLVRLAAAAVLAANTAAATGQNVVAPDLTKGNVDGLAGVLVWPGDLQGPNDEPKPFATAEGCDVHLVGRTNVDEELKYPCGKWFVLPVADRYDLWIETEGRITPNTSMINFARRPFQGRGTGLLIPTAPAGKVAVPAGRTVNPAESLRILATEVRHAWNNVIFDRRLAANASDQSVQMPEGRVIVGRFDRKTNEAIALSRPIDIKAGKTQRVWPEPPADSDVFVVLSKAPDLQVSKSPAPQLALLIDENKRPPDVVVNGFDRIIAIWYGVAGRTGTLSVESKGGFFAPQQIALRRGKVTTVRANLVPAPKAKVSITAPPDAPLPAELSLDVRRLGGEKPVRQLTVKPGLYELESLPAELLLLTLQIGPWKMTQNLDLTSGEDGAATFELKPIVIKGTVYYGDDPHAASVSFFTGEEKWPAVETNERGQYEVLFWWPATQVARITLNDRNLPPFTEAFLELLESGVHDFHVPRTDYAVRVRNARTGEPIEGVRVTAANLWIGDDDRRRDAAQHVVTNASGVAALPPLNKGQLIVDVRDPRYESPEPLTLEIDDQHHELDIAMKPLHAATELHLKLPDGTPASSADGWAFSDAMQPLWRGTADANGRLDIPDVAADSLLLVRHARAATTIRRVTRNEPEIRWSLDVPAEPLTVVSDIKPSAMLAIWLDDVKLTGPPLAFATWGTSMTNAAGSWTGRNLPARSLLLTLFPPSAATPAAFDSTARRIAYPWPPVVTASN